MRYITLKRNFYATWEAMVLLYTHYPTITPVIEEQIEHDLIAYLEAYGGAVDALDFISDDIIEDTIGESDLILVDPQTIAPLILQDVKRKGGTST